MLETQYQALRRQGVSRRSFLQFCKAAQTDGHIRLDWDEEADGYLVTA